MCLCLGRVRWCGRVSFWPNKEEDGGSDSSEGDDPTDDGEAFGDV